MLNRRVGFRNILKCVSVLLAGSLLAACGAAGDPAGMPAQYGAAEERPGIRQTEHPAKEDARLAQKRSEWTGMSVEEAADSVYGEVFPRLLYASDERAVLYGSEELLVYDFQQGRIEQLLDLKAVDLNYLHDSGAAHIEASDDGGQLLLYNEPDPTERFIYDIDEKRLEYTDLETFGERRYDGILEREEGTFAKTSSGKIVSLSADSLYTGDGECFHPDDMQGLSVLVADGAWGGAEVYPLFEQYYETTGEEVFPYLKLRDLGRVLGQEFLHEDEAGWRYYLEEDTEQESVIWDFADGMQPLLLTRYRGKERQVLDDLLFGDAWLECPVLFAGGRILYKAAAAPDITGVKEAALVSIATDGSDRRVADTVLYRVFDGLCDDNVYLYYSGWTNDNTQKKPLCRIAPDFSGGAQLVEEIPGLLCGVQDGAVYYLASGEKKPGIWKRELSSGEEQIYDKWGCPAEDMQFFWAREKIGRAHV